MSILVTGGAGFLGSYLTERLLSHGYTVTIVDDMSRGSEANISDITDHERLTVEDVDLLACDNVTTLVNGHDKVYHLAAKIGGVGYLRDRPAEIIADNDRLNYRVFEACVEADVDRLLYASSSMLYAEAATFPTPESAIEEIPPPRGSYGFQKLNGEYYCESYREQYGLEYVAARIFNAIGPRDWPEETVGHGHVLPDMVKKIVDERQDPVRIKGSGQQTRCFTDVRDTVRGLHRCMEVSEAGNEAFNISTTRETSIRELIEMIWDRSDREGDLSIKTAAEFEKDVKRRVPDVSKAEAVLDWTPEYSLEAAIERYLESYEGYRHAA